MSFFKGLKNLVIGRAKNFSDKNLFHKASLIAMFAWVGLGADPVSSSCYGPESVFLALGEHTYLSLFVALAVIVTIVVICMSYSQIIELFPSGGGGYLVASKLLSPTVGMVSGCALLVDYVLTIATSVAAGADAIFSMLPQNYLAHKTASTIVCVIFLTLINMRGVKESVMIWVPVFLLFIFTHFFAIIYALCVHGGDMPTIWHGVVADSHATCGQVGVWGLMAIMMRAYSLGAGTYTGIEAVSNGMPILREPRVQTGRRTIIYMGSTLGFLVGGLLLAYLLYQVKPEDGKTLNAVLMEHIIAPWPAWVGKIFIVSALASSALLLVIAAETGFLDGPRVMANMAVDRWMPTRFATLSDRLVAQNGVLLMGTATIIVLLSCSAAVDTLIVLYSINVFITFSLSQLGMVRHWWLDRANETHWKRKLLINGVGLLMTGGILISLIGFKFMEGGWVTLVVTGILIALAFWVKNHYRRTQKKLYRLNELTAVAMTDEAVTAELKPAAPCDPNARTAVFLVNGFNGLGLHTLLAVVRMFPKVYSNFIFVQVGVLDAGNFKGASEVDNLREHSEKEVERFVAYMKKRGFHAESRIALGTDIVDEAAKLCDQIAEKFPQAQFFAGQLVFKDESFSSRWLHNHTVFELQRRLYQSGRVMLILPIQV
jgi:amino acid transporter